jgi:uncharacterized protein
MRALITGATGFIGRRLASLLKQPVVLSRNLERARAALPGAEARAWDAEAGPPDPGVFDNVDVVFHLAGEPVAGRRWNEEHKRRVRDSRVLGTRYLVDAIERRSQRPAVLVSASAVGFYGGRGGEVLDESSPPGTDFLARITVEWETEARRAEMLGLRVVNPRMGIVLGEEGGALAKMLTPFKLGVGGRLGDGRQWMPWIHLDDVVGLLLHAANQHDIRGPMNVTAPQPVTNREFTAELGRVLRRPTVFPVPKLALWVAFGEMADVMLASQRVIPRVATETDYPFLFPELPAALRAIFKKEPPAGVAA